ncbi:MAG: hypothetical protein NZ952_00395 [Candidatus Bathyarchaeota archaeon]|nr:hypothetical protein [Candidatus Bathyarchaeota archaeon]
MSEEKIFKAEGEDLAKVSVNSGMGAKQLQTVYRLIKTKPLPYVQAYIKRQIGRDVKGFEGFSKMLDLVEKYEEDRSSLEKVFMYAVMLYDYIEKEPILGLKAIAEPVIRRIVERRGAELQEVKMSLRGKSLELNVKISRFNENPKLLALEIQNSLKSSPEFSSLDLRVWIDQR